MLRAARRIVIGLLIIVGVAAALLSGLIPIPRSVFYRNRRPTRLGRAINRAWSWTAGAGLTPYAWPGEPRGGTVSLEVAGRRSGRVRAVAVTWVEHEGERYLVSMLGEGVDWVRNVRAAGGEATVRHRERRRVELEEVPVGDRAPILRSYLRRTAMATREHLGVEPEAELDAFDRIAPEQPVFRIVELGG